MAIFFLIVSSPNKKENAKTEIHTQIQQIFINSEQFSL